MCTKIHDSNKIMCTWKQDTHLCTEIQETANGDTGQGDLGYKTLCTLYIFTIQYVLRYKTPWSCMQDRVYWDTGHRLVRYKTLSTEIQESV